MNFLWSQKELCKEKKKSEWFEKFELAKNYYKEHGDLFIPRSYIVNGFDLGNWLSNITSAYLGQSRRMLLDYQINALNSLFPDWYKRQPQVLWDKMYALACEYYNKYGNIRLSQDEKYNGVKLGSWLHHQKRRYRKGELPQERIDLLEKLNIWWNPTYDRWYENYNEAKKYYQQFGSLDIPNDYTCNGVTVGRWIAVQREAYNGRKDTRLTDWQKKMLDDIGMIWETKRAGNATSFNEQTVLYYASLVYPGTISRYKLNGYELDIYIPEIRTAIEYDGVYWHKDKQERDFEKSRICRKNKIRLIRIREKGLPIIEKTECYSLSDDFENSLKQIFQNVFVLFSPDVNIDRDREKIMKNWKYSTSMAWYNEYLIAKEYYEENGNLLVPSNYKTKKDFLLGNWIGNQRGRYFGRGNVPLNENQIRLLENIGMVWNTLTDKWERKYKIAEQYYKEFGTLRMRTETVYKGLRLGKWLCLQRVQRKTAKNYSKERIEKLNNIGMIWNTKKDTH